ncbi:MAG: hypothetical protein HGA76_03630 [Candidatus Firestonebacteria bacterium]|nr:hypothetical protein [Candidatus Firestonebacteria bacterium]
MAALPNKRYFYVLLAISLLLALASVSCQKAAPSRPNITAAAAAAFSDSIVYTSAGTLYMTNLTGDRVERLPGSSGNDWFPSTSPDQNLIAFWSNASGSYELWVLDLNAERRLQLTSFNETAISADVQNFGVHNAPAWSPDGRRIAFAFYGKIWLMESTGFNPETVITDGENFSPAWSPDGNLLAFVANRGKTHNLYLHKISTAEEWALTSFPSSQTAAGPVWSPDGKVLAFTVSSREDTDIWSIRADGTRLTRLTQDKRSHSPAWSPDSKRLAFASGRQDPFHWEIWAMNADASGAFSVTRNGGFSPTWLRVPSRPFAPAAAPMPPVENPTASEHAKNEPETAPKLIRRAPEVLKVTVPTPLPAATLAPTPKLRPTFTTQPTPQPEPTLAPAISQPAATAVPAEPTFAPTAPPTAKPTPQPVMKKATAVPTPAPTAKPEPPRSAEPENKTEDDYAEYENSAEADTSILPNLDIVEDVQSHRIIYKPKIDFYFGKDLIKPSGFPVLSRLAEELGKNNDAPLIVQGRPSGPGWVRFFLGTSLSRARANSVLRHLIVTEKIRQINVNALGEGDEFPDLGKRAPDQPELLILVK